MSNVMQQIINKKIRIGKGLYRLIHYIATQCQQNSDMPPKKMKSTLKANPPTNNEKMKSISFDQYQYKKTINPIKIEFDKEASQEKETIQEKENQGVWQPSNWKEFLHNLRIMRSKNDAPVDTMGCDKGFDEDAPPAVFRYQSLISLMLSSQTRDQVTFAAMERLRARGLTIANVLNMTDEELGELIKPVGFWKTKVKYIKKTSQILKDQYNNDIPDTAEKMCKLIGVGPKMAHICMKVAWNKVTGIGVDTHVHRISNRIGWVKKTTKTPEDTRKALESWLPFELWSEVNNLMVGFGQTVCAPIGPSCDECLNRSICPYTGKCRKSPNKRKLSPMKQELYNEKPMVIKNEICENDFDVESKSIIKVAHTKLKSEKDNKGELRTGRVLSRACNKKAKEVKVKEELVDDGLSDIG